MLLDELFLEGFMRSKSTRENEGIASAICFDVVLLNRTNEAFSFFLLAGNCFIDEEIFDTEF